MSKKAKRKKPEKVVAPPMIEMEKGGKKVMVVDRGFYKTVVKTARQQEKYKKEADDADTLC